MQQGHLLLTARCLPAGVYTGTGNNGLSFAACPNSTIMQSLAGEVNTVIDLAGGPRAFTFTTEQPGTTLSGMSLSEHAPYINPKLSEDLDSEQRMSALSRRESNDQLNEQLCDLMSRPVHRKADVFAQRHRHLLQV